MKASAEPEKQSQYKPNTKPIQSQYKPNPRKAKMNENLFATKVYENITTFRLEQYKPNQTQNKPKKNAALRSTEKVRVVKVGDTGLEPVTSCV